MEALGNLVRRLLAWLVLAAAVLLLVKLVWGAVVGFVQAILLVVALVIVGSALLWALRRV